MPITKLKHNNLTPDDVLTWQKEQAARLLQSWKDFSGEDMETCDENSLAIIADALNEHFLFVNIPAPDEDTFAIVGEQNDQVMEGELEGIEDCDIDPELDEEDEDDSDSDLEDPSDLDEECDSDLEEDDDEFPLDERDDEDEPDEEEE